MRKALLTLMCLGAMLSSGINLMGQGITITLKPDWTWIGCPRSDTVDLVEAMGAFTPMEGDMIEAEYGLSMFDEGEWFGDVQEFYPGVGYLYYSTRSEAVSVVLGLPAPQVSVVTSEPSGITATNAVVGGNVTIGQGNHIYVQTVCVTFEVG